jgi:MoxR-like ATPase
MSTTSDAVKSCTDCPSYVTPTDAIGVFGKSVGAPLCQRFGYVLGTPDMSGHALQKVGEKVASTCTYFGLARAATTGDNFSVTIPDPDARSVLSDLAPEKVNCRSCAMCKNHVPDDVVQDKFGFTTGMCAAKGKLILPLRRTEEANGCQFRCIGPQRRNADDLHLIPVLLQIAPRPGGLASVGGDEFVRGPGSVVEPSEYPSDLEVTEEHVERGIRAWRKIEDPEGTGNVVYLPIYDEKFFEESEREKIPRTGDDEHPELYIDHNAAIYRIAVLWRELDETPMAWGMPGVGKTEVFRHLAWLMGMPFDRISINGSSEIDDLAGKMLYSKEKGTYFHPGRVTRRWALPGVMVVDEPNTGPNEVWEFIRPMTDNSKQLVIDMSDNPVAINRHDDCYLGLAGNPHWNALNVGTQVLGDADASRLMHIEFNLPPEHIERAIIQNRVRIDGWEIDSKRLDFVMNVASAVRELANNGSLPLTWGIRSQLKVARALPWFSPVTAYRMAVADYLDPERQQQLLDQVRAHCPSPPAKFPPIKWIEG